MTPIFTKLKTWSAFDKAVLLTLGALVLVVAVLTIALTTVGLHVRRAQLVGEQQAAEIINQQIRLTFNRPLAAAAAANFVFVEPAAPHTVTVSDADLIVKFNQNLNSDTEYAVVVRQELQDIYGNMLDETYRYGFKTRSLELVYIESNPEAADRVVRRSGDLSTATTLYEADTITSYAYRAPYLVVVQPRTPDLSDAVLINTRNGRKLILTEDKENAYQVAFSPVTDEVFILLEQTTIDQGVVVSQTGRYILTYNMRTDQAYPLSIGAEIADIDQFVVSQDGKALLAKDTFNGIYYLVNIADPKQFVSLGQYTGTGGFDHTATSVIFSAINLVQEDSLPYVVSVTNDRQTKTLTPPNRFSIDAIFMRTGGGVVFSQRFADLANTRGFFELALMDATGKVTQRARKPGYSLELASISPDDRFIAVEGYTAQSMQDLQNVRVLGFQSKPARASIFIYNVSTRSFMSQSFDGLFPQWF